MAGGRTRAASELLGSGAEVLRAMTGRPPQPSRTELLLRARRQFDAVPADYKSVNQNKLSTSALMQMAEMPHADGVFVTNSLGPDYPIFDWDLPRATALYPRGDRAVRRHEVMHGIQSAARQDSSLAAALPVWARGAKPNSFADELLARLAQQQPGALLDWPLGAYRTGAVSGWPSSSPRAYQLAEPVQWAGRQIRDRPVATGAAIGGLALGGAANMALLKEALEDE